MRNHNRAILARTLFTLAVFTVFIADSHARSTYGPTVDDACLTFNGTQPYADYAAQNSDPCTFCHVPKPGSKSTRVDPQWTWWQNQFTQITNFCPEQTNQAPDGTITAPGDNSTFNLGTTVDFSGTGTDPDQNTPLSYLWDFGGAADNTAVQNPSMLLNSAGAYTVTFTVTDSLGRADPTPATITLNVVDPNANQPPNGTIDSPAGNVSINVGESVPFSGSATDPDAGNTGFSYFWNFGGGAADSSEQNPTVTFNNSGIYTATFTVTDSDGLSDPTPATRTVSVGLNGMACTDQDHDLFSPDGGVCGPIDCNDFDAAINPGALEACGDHVDNDCNGDIDASDAHCRGGDCVAELLKQVEITAAYWENGEMELKVKGTWTALGATVKLSDALTGASLGTTTVHLDEEEPANPGAGNYPWEFELDHPAVVPCRVRAEIDGRYGERDVAYAPADCSGKPPVTNNPPVANDDTATTGQRETVKIAVLANDTDSDQDTLSIAVFSQPQHGVVIRDGDYLDYTPARGFIGNDSFTYGIADGHGGTDTATVTVTVTRTERRSDDR